MGRTQILTTSSGLVEDVTGRVVGRRRSPEGFSPEFQLALPYRGVFVWHVGRDDVVGDPNQMLFVTGGEPFRVSGPRPGEYAELIVTPSFSVLSQHMEGTGFDLPSNPLFRARSSRATPAVQRAAARLLHRATWSEWSDALAEEESLFELLRAALQIELKQAVPSARTRRLIQRTKEYLQSTFMRALHLTDIADAVGTTATYLTDVFTRFEGVSLKRYITQLRLARALIELNQMDDLTELALSLGFSSHSHFTLAFRRAFGCTPSAFRSATRRSRSRPVPRRSSVAASGSEREPRAPARNGAMLR